MAQKNLKEKYGDWALVTGASAGIGEEFAYQLAEQGFNLVLVARREQKLQSLASKLVQRYGIQVRVAAADLSKQDFIDSILEATSDIDIGLLINNAGLYFLGEFLEQDLDAHLSMLEVNTRAPLLLSHTFGNKMRQQGRGGIIIVSSTVSGSGAPFNANYAATKSYDLVLGEGLEYELKKHGVDVQVLMPGGTWTEGAHRMMKDAPAYMNNMMMETKPVVAASLNKLGKKSRVIPGQMNQFMTWLTARLMPRGLAVRMWANMMRGMMGEAS